MKHSKIRPVLLVLIGALLLLSAGCAQQDEGDLDDPQVIIIEPGIDEENPSLDNEDDQETEENEEEGFIDYGSAATLEDLTTAQSKVQSYYFQQTIPYLDGSVVIQVWFKDNQMKWISTMDGMVGTEMYYDFNENKVISYTPSEGNTAIMMEFSPSDPDLPDQPKADDYLSYTVVATEEIDGQVCKVLQTDTGDKLWVSTLYGMPLQVEFTDSLGDRYTVAYENLRINDISDKEIALPEGVTVYDMGASGL